MSKCLKTRKYILNNVLTILGGEMLGEINAVEAENKRYRGVLKDAQEYLRSIPNWPDVEREHVLDVQIELVLKESEI